MTSKESKKEKETKKVEVCKFYSTTIKSNLELSLEDITKLHADFQPLVATYSLAKVFDEISANKDKKDDAQKKRLEKALALLGSKIPLASFPDKTKAKLLKGLKKQLK